MRLGVSERTTSSLDRSLPTGLNEDEMDIKRGAFSTSRRQPVFSCVSDKLRGCIFVCMRVGDCLCTLSGADSDRSTAERSKNSADEFPGLRRSARGYFLAAESLSWVARVSLNCRWVRYRIGSELAPNWVICVIIWASRLPRLSPRSREAQTGEPRSTSGSKLGPFW